MERDQIGVVKFTNQIYAFIKFQEQYKNLCQEISEEKRSNLMKCLKKISSFFSEYKYYVRSKEIRDIFTKHINNIKLELYDDEIYSKLCVTPSKNINESIVFNQKYYYYLIKILKITGSFGDELSSTFMPNKSDRVKYFKYFNGNSFFEQFTYYKSATAGKIADFNIRSFKNCFSYFLGFYFAYYLFVDEKSRYICENVFSDILSLYLNKEILKLIFEQPNILNPSKKLLIKEIDFDIHKGINSVFFRCNYSYSLYGIMPKKQNKVLIDRTTI